LFIDEGVIAENLEVRQNASFHLHQGQIIQSGTLIHMQHLTRTM